MGRRALFQRVLLLLFALLLMAGREPQSLHAAKIVRGSGIGVILQKNVVAARDSALRKAFSAALEESVAGLFDFSSLSSYDAAVKEILARDPLEYIERYRILNDARDGNLYKIEVEAWVSEEKIKKRLADVGLIRYTGKTLELGLLIQTRMAEGVPRNLLGSTEEDFSGFAEQEYQSRGFGVVHDLVSADDVANSFEKLRLSNRLTAMQGRRVGADAVVLGLIEIHPAGNDDGVPLPGEYRVKLWVRAIRSSDAELLGIREAELTIRKDSPDFMIRQLIQQRLDGLLAALGEEIRKDVR
jgi:hypothetical protein